jgi:hypothetical protein
LILARDGFEAFVSNTVARIFDRERQTRGIALAPRPTAPLASLQC